MSYLERHLWDDLDVTSPKHLWVAECLLRIPSELIEVHRKNLNSLIYKVYFSMGSHENSYVTKYNAARCDLITKLIVPPQENEGIVRIATEPEGDSSYWLCTHVLGFTDIELSVLCDIDVDQLEQPMAALLPLLKRCYRLLQRVKLNDPLMQHYHRSRHLMIRYYLDAEYHEI